MPIEVAILEGTKSPINKCPKCGDSPFRPFLRGQVQRWPWSWKTLWLPVGKMRAYCALICWKCKDIVGYE